MIKINKIILFAVLFMFLNGCVQSTAFLGPAITVGTTGNIFQASVQYGTNQAIKKETGKDALTFITEAVEEDQKYKKFHKDNKELVELLENRIKTTREKILKESN